MALLLGIAALLGASGLQTIWAPPETMTAAVGQEPAEAPLTVITSGIAEVDDEPVEFTVSGGGSFNVMLGRERDVQAWVGDSAHNTVTGITTEVPRGEAPRIEVEHTDGEATGPNPRGSDLWVDVQAVQDRLDQRWSVPSDGDWALLIARDGIDPAPTEMTVTWTNRVGDSPWIVPLYVIGVLLVLIGLALLAWSLARKRRGPGGASGRRAAPGAGPTVPGGAGGGSGTGGASGTGATRGTSARASASPSWAVNAIRPASAVRGVGAGAAVLAIVLAGVGPAAASSTAAPASTEPADAGTKGAPGEEVYPVLTDTQLERILREVSEVVQAGDASLDAEKLKPRVARHALEMRTTNYRNRDIDDSVQAPAPIAASAVLSAVAVSDPSFPRTAMAVTEGEGNSTPQLLMLQQDSARTQYRLVATAPMTPGAQLPAGDLSQTGIEVIGQDDATDLVISPWYALNGTARYLGDAGNAFSQRIVGNPYMDAIHKYQDGLVASAQDARFAFSRQAVPDSMIALRLADGSAIAIGMLDAHTIARPREEGGTVIVDELAAELGGDGRETTEGLQMTYREVLALHIPAADASGDDARISLAGMTDELRSVEFLD